MIKILTNRGFILNENGTSKILLKDNSIKEFKDLKIGDKIKIITVDYKWPSEEIKIDYQIPKILSLLGVAKEASVSVATVQRYLNGKNVLKKEKLEEAFKFYKKFNNQIKRKNIKIPNSMSNDFAAFLGYLIGDGHISKVKREIGLTSGDIEQIQHFSILTQKLFDLNCKINLDESGGARRWRATINSLNLQDFLLNYIKLTFGPSARIKRIPDLILNSPECVVNSFIRAYFDCDGYGGKGGVILSTSSDYLAEQIQLLLLRYEIISSRKKAKDECWRLLINGTSAYNFSQKIGFGLKRKQNSLEKALGELKYFKTENWNSTITNII